MGNKVANQVVHVGRLMARKMVTGVVKWVVNGWLTGGWHVVNIVVDGVAHAWAVADQCGDFHMCAWFRGGVATTTRQVANVWLMSG